MTDDNQNPVAQAIADAEIVSDPIGDLIESVGTDPGAALLPEALQALEALKTSDPGEFENVRARLKKAGCRISAVDKALANFKAGAGGGRTKKAANILIELSESAELFHTPDKTGYADVLVKGHRETWPIIRSKQF